jgi:hypothetical protein
MATCPRCRGHLTDTHRCPRRPRRTFTRIAIAGLAGALVAMAAIALVDPEGRLAHIDALVITAGLGAGIGLDQLLRLRY